MSIKRVKYNKTEVNSEELNIMVRKSATASLKEVKKKRTHMVATGINVYIDKYEAFVVDRIDLEYLV